MGGEDAGSFGGVRESGRFAIPHPLQSAAKGRAPGVVPVWRRAGSVVERFEQLWWCWLDGRSFGFAQDDEFVEVWRRANTGVLHCVQDDESMGGC